MLFLDKDGRGIPTREVECIVLSVNDTRPLENAIREAISNNPNKELIAESDTVVRFGKNGEGKIIMQKLWFRRRA